MHCILGPFLERGDPEQLVCPSAVVWLAGDGPRPQRYKVPGKGSGKKASPWAAAAAIISPWCGCKKLLFLPSLSQWSPLESPQVLRSSQFHTTCPGSRRIVQ